MRKNNSRSRRFFRIGERVFNCDYHEEDNFDFGKILLINGKAEDALVGEDDIVTLAMEHNDFTGENECYGDNIYKICRSRTERNGVEVCFEHHKEIDYPYFVPANDENYYGIELA